MPFIKPVVLLSFVKYVKGSAYSWTPDFVSRTVSRYILRTASAQNRATSLFVRNSVSFPYYVAGSRLKNRKIITKKIENNFRVSIESEIRAVIFSLGVGSVFTAVSGALGSFCLISHIDVRRTNIHSKINLREIKSCELDINRNYKWNLAGRVA